MPIEFACENCTKLLRVPDGTAGRSCECPACATILEIPDPDVIEVVEVTETSNSDSRVAIACPKCQHQLVCDSKLLGTRGQCRRCQYIFTISTDPASAENAAAGLTFNCPKCQQLFEGKPEMEGRKGKCHVCGEVFAIELKQAIEPELDTQPTFSAKPPGNPQRSRPQPKQEQAPELPPIQFSCPSCSGVLEVPGGAAGQTTSCPFCEQLLEIPSEQEAQTEAFSTAAPEAFSSAPPEPVDATPGWSQLQDLSGDMTSADMGRTNNPYVSSPYSSPQAAQTTRRLGNLPSGRSSATYTAPGIALIVMGTLGVISIILGMILRLAALSPSVESSLAPEQQAQSVGFLIGTVVGGITGLLFMVMYILGGVALLRRRGLSTARSAAIIACIPCISCLALNIPIGIWSCVIVFSDKARRDFR